MDRTRLSRLCAWVDYDVDAGPALGQQLLLVGIVNPAHCEQYLGYRTPGLHDVCDFLPSHFGQAFAVQC